MTLFYLLNDEWEKFIILKLEIPVTRPFDSTVATIVSVKPSLEFAAHGCYN
jgi:hypothetical protein